jgi:DNA-binding GntR family transcriptional regulator
MGTMPAGCPNETEETRMDPQDQVLDAMRAAGAPLNAGAVAERTGLDRKVVDKALAALKAEGAIESPKRCYWQPAS